MKRFWTILAIAVAAAAILLLVFKDNIFGNKKTEEPMMKNTAVVVVDELYDFIDGSLACQGAVECVKNSAAFLSGLEGVPILYTCDYHPANHCSFVEQGGPWPPHCVQGTRGGEIADELKPYVTEELVFLKGDDPMVEQYSGFEGHNAAGQTMGEVLEVLGIENVIVIGIATEFCVRNTAEDLLKAGYKVTIQENCLACVDPQGHVDAIAAMKEEGIIFTGSPAPVF